MRQLSHQLPSLECALSPSVDRAADRNVLESFARADRGTSRVCASTIFFDDLPVTHEFRRARQAIERLGDRCDDIALICAGWAFRFIQLSDGRRQILSLLLPGD